MNNLDPDVIYYSADIINNSTVDPIGNRYDPQVQIYAQRQYPILQDANEYMMSCIRMNTSGATQNLPVWIPRIQTASVSAEFVASIQSNTATGVTTMTVTSLQGTLAVGSAFSGSGVATLSAPGQPLIQVPILFGSNSNQPRTILTTPPPTSTTFPAIYTLQGLCPIITYEGVQYADYVISQCNLTVGNEQQDPDLTVYSVTLEHAGLVSQVYLRWTTENPATPPPTRQGQNVVNQDINSDYYYGYSYANFIRMFDTALTTAQVNVGIAASPGYLRKSDNNANGDFEIEVDDLGEKAGLIAGDVLIYLNSNLASLLPYFPSLNTNDTLGRTVLLDFTTLEFQQTGRLPQEAPGVSGWSPVDALVVTTSTIPVVVEQVSAPGSVGNSNTGNLNTTPAAFQKVIADISIGTNGGYQDWRNDISWTPTAEYQMISLQNSSSPINIIDLAVWWRCRLDNNLYPLRLVNNSSVSLKLMFRRKQLGV